MSLTVTLEQEIGREQAFIDFEQEPFLVLNRIGVPTPSSDDRFSYYLLNLLKPTNGRP